MGAVNLISSSLSLLQRQDCACEFPIGQVRGS